jgi:hypothetical protein
MRREEHVAHVGEINAYRIYSENLNLRLRVTDGMLIVRRILTKLDAKLWSEFNRLLRIEFNGGYGS